MLDMLEYERLSNVKAVAMTLREYYQYVGFVALPSTFESEDGYLIETKGDIGGCFTHVDHEGYVSWLSKDTFESDYALIRC